MTAANKTAIAILVDRSGSMQACRADAEGAINAFLQDQKQQPGEATVLVAEFDTEYDVVHPSMPIKDVPSFVLSPRGGTALLDGIGKITVDLGAELAAMPENERPAIVIVVVQTDGEENSSREWTAETVKAKITEQTETYGWTFIFLGATMDAVETAKSYGFSGSTSMAYGEATMDSAMASTSNLVTTTRSGLVAGYTQADRDAAVGGTN